MFFKAYKYFLLIPIFSIRTQSILHYKTINHKYYLQKSQAFYALLQLPWLLLILSTYLSAVILLFLNETTKESVFFKIKITILEFLLSWNTLHIIMYIERVRAYLKASAKFILNASLSQNEIYFKERVSNLKNLKKMYFDWWIIIQKINIYFGWSLLALMMKFLVQIFLYVILLFPHTTIEF